MALGTKPRWDKYDGYVGNFRGALGWDVDLDETNGEANKVLAVGTNSAGAIVRGSGQTGVNGLLIVAVGVDIHGNLLDGGINNMTGDPQDVGAHGEITNFQPYDDSDPGNVNAISSAAGTNYYGFPDGSVLAATGSGATYIGHTQEADRLIVDVSSHGPAGTVQDNVPKGVAATAGTTGTAVVSWFPVRGATGYKLKKSTDGSTFANGSPATAAAGATSSTQTGLSAGVTYFEVIATVGGVDSAVSQIVKCTVV